MRQSIRIMRCLIVCLFLVSILAPAAPVAAMQGDCPEGLVYDDVNDACVLPENLPPDQEGIGEPPDGAEQIEDGQDDAADDQPVEGQDDAADAGDDQVEDGQDDAANLVGDEDGEDGGTGEDGAAGGSVANIVIAAYPCPVGWDPAVNSLADSIQVCTTATLPGMTYTLFFAGKEITSIGVPGQIDAARDLSGLKRSPGTWTIQEKPLSGLADPYASCSVTASDGSVILTIEQVVPGGTLDFTLAEGDTLNCTWFAIPDAPAGIGDAGVAPIAGLRVALYSCPAGWNPAAKTYTESLAVCTYAQAPEFVFSALRDGVEVSSAAGAPIKGGKDVIDFVEAAGTPLYSGKYTIAGTVPPGYAAPYVTCAVQAAGASDYTGVPVTVVNGSVDLAVGAGEDAVCQWFNLETTPRPETTRGINVVIHTCPPDWEPMGKTEDANKASCTEPMPAPVTVRFIQGGVEQDADVSTSKDDYASAYYDDHLPDSGRWIIKLDMPVGAGSSLGYCRAYDTAGKNTKVTLMNGYDNSAPITIDPNDLVNCDWYTQPNKFADILQIQVRNCPAGFDAANAPLSTALGTCQATSAAEFTVMLNGSNFTVLQSDINGVAGVRVVAGAYVIRGTVAAGFGKPYVTCTYTAATSPQPQTITPLIGDDQRSIGFDLAAGDRMICNWFEIPGQIVQADPAVLGQVFRCPDDVDRATAGLDVLVAQCVVPANGIAVTVSSLGVVAGSATTDADGTYRVGALPRGDFGAQSFSIDVQLEDLVAFCLVSPSGDGAPPAQIPVQNGTTIQQQVGAGETLRCEWFGGGGNPGEANLPDNAGEGLAGEMNPPANGGDPLGNPPAGDGNVPGVGGTGNQLVVQVWQCPADLAAEEAYETQLTECPAAPASAGITAGGTSAETVADQVAIWKDLPPGDLELAGAQPGDGGIPALFCSSSSVVDGQQVDTFATGVMVTDGVAVVTIPASGTVVCDWFNR